MGIGISKRQQTAYMSKKLPPGEAKRRHDERNRIQNEKLKEKRRQDRIAKGLPPVSTPEWRKEQMRLYINARRAKIREANAEANAAKRAAKKAATAARLLEKKLEKEKEKRRLAWENGKVDMRGKFQRPVKAKPDKPVKPIKLKTIRKEKDQVRPIVIRKIDTSVLIPLKLDAKTTIYVKPGTDIEATRQRFLSRK